MRTANKPSPDEYAFQRPDDNSGFVTTDGQPIQSNGGDAVPILLADDNRLVTPTIGFILKF